MSSKQILSSQQLGVSAPPKSFYLGAVFFLVGVSSGFLGFRAASYYLASESFSFSLLRSGKSIDSKYADNRGWISDKEVLTLNMNEMGDQTLDLRLKSGQKSRSASLRDEGRGGVSLPDYSFNENTAFKPGSRRHPLTGRLRHDLLEQLTRENGEIEALDSMDKIERLVSRTPIGAPVLGRLTSHYGKRNSPFGSHGRDFHTGLDIAVDEATPIYASADGEVRLARSKGAYGKTVVIEHPAGLETLYAHLSKITVKEGQHICRGQQIGMVGTTGRSTGPHLHYEIRENGTPVDPYPFIELASVLRFAK